MQPATQSPRPGMVPAMPSRPHLRVSPIGMQVKGLEGDAEHGAADAGVIVDKLGRHWNAALHPRDARGRFIETGGIVREMGGGIGKVTRVLPDGRVEVQHADGSITDDLASRITMIRRADGSLPTSNHFKVIDADAKRAEFGSLPGEISLDHPALAQDAERAAHPPRFSTVKQAAAHLASGAVDAPTAAQTPEAYNAQVERAKATIGRITSPTLSPDGAFIIGKEPDRRGWRVFHAGTGLAMGGHSYKSKDEALTFARHLEEIEHNGQPVDWHGEHLLDKHEGLANAASEARLLAHGDHVAAAEAKKAQKAAAKPLSNDATSAIGKAETNPDLEVSDAFKAELGHLSDDELTSRARDLEDSLARMADGDPEKIKTVRELRDAKQAMRERGLDPDQGPEQLPPHLRELAKRRAEEAEQARSDAETEKHLRGELAGLSDDDLAAEVAKSNPDMRYGRWAREEQARRANEHAKDLAEHAEPYKTSSELHHGAGEAHNAVRALLGQRGAYAGSERREQALAAKKAVEHGPEENTPAGHIEHYAQLSDALHKMHNDAEGDSVQPAIKTARDHVDQHLARLRETKKGIDNAREAVAAAEAGHTGPAPTEEASNGLRRSGEEALADVPTRGVREPAEPGPVLHGPGHEGAAEGAGAHAGADELGAAGHGRPAEGAAAPVGAPHGGGDRAGSGGVAPTGAGLRGQRAAVEEPLRPGLHDLGSPDEPGIAPAGDAPRVTSDAERYTAEANEFTAGTKTAARANIEAIRLAKQIVADKREATPEEQKVLAKFTSWGALPQMFDPKRDDFAAERGELAKLLTPEELEAARDTAINAHYTAPHMTQSMWAAMQDLGFEGGTVLEPGSGLGNFFGSAPDGAHMLGVERDPVTALISQALYPHAKVITSRFERVKIKPDSVDAAIGNVPFSEIRPAEDNPGNHVLHDAFILKTLRSLKPGGVAQLMTSTGTLDKADDRARREMNEQADLIGAVRLPADAHAKSAGTGVVTDILLFRKRLPGEKPRGEKFVGRSTVTGVDGNPIDVNSYFAAHPEHVLGDLHMASGRYGADTEMSVRSHDLTQVPDQLLTALRGIARGGKARDLQFQPDLGDKHTPEQAVEQVAQRAENAGIRMEGHITAHPDGTFSIIQDGLDSPLDVPKTRAKQVAALCDLRDLRTALIHEEKNHSEDTPLMAELRDRLNKSYGAYAKRYGAIWDVKAGKERLDPRTGKMAAKLNRTIPPVWQRDRLGSVAVDSLEDYNPDTKVAKKAAIFSKRVIKPATPIDKAENPADALNISLNTTGGVNLDKIASLLDLPDADAARHALGNLVYDDPASGQVVDSASYLSGNVRKKLAEARAMAQADPSFERNVTALEKAVPPDVRIDQIDARPGAPWIGPDVLTAYVQDRFESPRAKVSNPGGGTGWQIDLPVDASNHQAVRERWGLKGYTSWDAGAIFKSLIQQSPIIVRREDPATGKSVVVPEATMAANQRAQEMLADFKQWLFADPERAAKLQRIYNDTCNFLAEPNYEGRTVDIDGLSWDLRPHQHEAIARGVADPTMLLAHQVGFGKTLVMQGQGMKLRQLGLANKPAHVVPNHMLEQYAKEYLQAFPDAKVLVARKSDLAGSGSADTLKKRMAFAARAASGDWDAVIFTHSAFELLPMSPDAQEAYLNREVGHMRAELEARLAAGGDDAPGVKKLVKQLEAYEQKVRKQIDGAREKGGVTFEDTGIDYLFVDEAHLFKNLMTQSRIQGAGIAGSKRAQDIHMKLEHLRATKGPGAKIGTFATATPISNSMTEAFTMQRFMRPDLLEDAGAGQFDRWASLFGEVVTKPEVDVTGRNFRNSSRFRKFTNVPEMLKLFRAFADVRLGTAEGVVTPNVKDGGPKTILVKPSEMQEDYLRRIGERAEAVRNGMVDKTEDNLLKISGDGRKAALDMRLVGEDDPESPKLEAAADQITSIYQRTKDRRYYAGRSDVVHETPGALQLVFMDLGTPKENTPPVVNRAADRLNPLLDMVERGQMRRGVARERLKEPLGKMKREDLEALAYNLGLDTSDYDEDTTKGEVASDVIDALVPDDDMSPLGRLQTVEFDPTNPPWSAYQELKNKLVERGVPEDGIRFIHDADTDEKKAQLFDEARNGKVSVLLGSTSKMGMGTNVQDRAVALHHLDVPWRPADLEQRDGRVIRQFNQNPDVDIYRYVTEGTFDSFMWQGIARKQAFINAAMKGDMTVREIEDLSNEELDASEIVALATGNPWLMRKAAADGKKAELLAAQASHNLRTRQAADSVRSSKLKVEISENLARNLEPVVGKLKDVSGEHFTVNVGGKDITDREQADAAVKTTLAKLYKDSAKGRPGEWQQIGHFAGVPLMARYNRATDSNDSWMELAGGDGMEARPVQVELKDLELGSSNKPLRRLENTFKSAPESVERAKNTAAQARIDAQRAEEDSKKPFDKAEDLDKAKQHADAVDAIISAQANEVENTDPELWQHLLKHEEELSGRGQQVKDEGSGLLIVQPEKPAPPDSVPDSARIDDVVQRDWTDRKAEHTRQWQRRAEQLADEFNARTGIDDDETAVGAVADALHNSDPDVDRRLVERHVAKHLNDKRAKEAAERGEPTPEPIPVPEAPHDDLSPAPDPTSNADAAERDGLTREPVSLETPRNATPDGTEDDPTGMQTLEDDLPPAGSLVPDVFDTDAAVDDATEQAATEADETPQLAPEAEPDERQAALEQLAEHLQQQPAAEEAAPAEAQRPEDAPEAPEAAEAETPAAPRSKQAAIDEYRAQREAAGKPAVPATPVVDEVHTTPHGTYLVRADKTNDRVFETTNRAKAEAVLEHLKAEQAAKGDRVSRISDASRIGPVATRDILAEGDKGPDDEALADKIKRVGDAIGSRNAVRDVLTADAQDRRLVPAATEEQPVAEEPQSETPTMSADDWLAQNGHTWEPTEDHGSAAAVQDEGEDEDRGTFMRQLADADRQIDAAAAAHRENPSDENAERLQNARQARLELLMGGAEQAQQAQQAISDRAKQRRTASQEPELAEQEPETPEDLAARKIADLVAASGGNGQPPTETPAATSEPEEEPEKAAAAGQVIDSLGNDLREQGHHDIADALTADQEQASTAQERIDRLRDVSRRFARQAEASAEKVDKHRQQAADNAAAGKEKRYIDAQLKAAAEHSEAHARFAHVAQQMSDAADQAQRTLGGRKEHELSDFERNAAEQLGVTDLATRRDAGKLSRDDLFREHHNLRQAAIALGNPAVAERTGALSSRVHGRLDEVAAELERRQSEKTKGVSHLSDGWELRDLDEDEGFGQVHASNGEHVGDVWGEVTKGGVRWRPAENGSTKPWPVDYKTPEQAGEALKNKVGQKVADAEPATTPEVSEDTAKAGGDAVPQAGTLARNTAKAHGLKDGDRAFVADPVGTVRPGTVHISRDSGITFTPDDKTVPEVHLGGTATKFYAQKIEDKAPEAETAASAMPEPAGLRVDLEDGAHLENLDDTAGRVVDGADQPLGTIEARDNGQGEQVWQGTVDGADKASDTTWDAPENAAAAVAEESAGTGGKPDTVPTAEEEPAAAAPSGTPRVVETGDNGHQLLDHGDGTFGVQRGDGSPVMSGSEDTAQAVFDSLQPHREPVAALEDGTPVDDAALHAERATEQAEQAEDPAPALTRDAEEAQRAADEAPVSLSPDAEEPPAETPGVDDTVPDEKDDPFSAYRAIDGEKYAPTPQQGAVIDAVLHGKTTLVQAKAGAGKTSTLEAIARRLQKYRKGENVGYVAFNKSVQLEAEKRMPSNVEARTGHSIAFQWASKELRDRFSQKDALRRPDEIARHLRINEPLEVGGGEAPLTPAERAQAAVRTVDTFANSADDKIGPQHLPERLRGLPPEAQKALIGDANKVWKDLTSPDGKVKLTLDHIRKMWALSRPDFTKQGSGFKKPVHVLFLDEAQDTPPVLAKVIEDQKCQKVIVGDADQAIYGFTGATDYLSHAQGDTELPLTKSWRFGPEVAGYGNRFLTLLGSKTRVEGAGGPSRRVAPGSMTDADAILTRSNGGMLGEIVREQEAGRTVGVPKGTKQDLQSLIRTARYLKGETASAPERMHDDLAPYRSWAEVGKDAEKGDDPKIAMLHRIVEQYGTDGLQDIVDRTIEHGDSGLDGVSISSDDRGTVLGGETWKLNEQLKRDGHSIGQAGFRYVQHPTLKDKNGRPVKQWVASGTPAEQDAALAKLRVMAGADTRTPDVTVSTAHKAKGLEWGKVRIGDDFRGPQTDKNTGITTMPSPEELRLAYVAATRAEHELDPGSLSWVEDHTTDADESPSMVERPVEQAGHTLAPVEVAKDLEDIGASAPENVEAATSTAEESPAEVEQTAEEPAGTAEQVADQTPEPIEGPLTSEQEHDLFGDIEEHREHTYSNLHERTADQLETADAADFFGDPARSQESPGKFSVTAAAEADRLRELADEADGSQQPELAAALRRDASRMDTASTTAAAYAKRQEEVNTRHGHPSKHHLLHTKWHWQHPIHTAHPRLHRPHLVHNPAHKLMPHHKLLHHHEGLRSIRHLRHLHDLMHLFDHHGHHHGAHNPSGQLPGVHDFHFFQPHGTLINPDAPRPHFDLSTPEGRGAAYDAVKHVAEHETLPSVGAEHLPATDGMIGDAKQFLTANPSREEFVHTAPRADDLQPDLEDVAEKAGVDLAGNERRLDKMAEHAAKPETQAEHAAAKQAFDDNRMGTVNAENVRWHSDDTVPLEGHAHGYRVAVTKGSVGPNKKATVTLFDADGKKVRSSDIIPNPATTKREAEARLKDYMSGLIDDAHRGDLSNEAYRARKVAQGALAEPNAHGLVPRPEWAVPDLHHPRADRIDARQVRPGTLVDALVPSHETYPGSKYARLDDVTGRFLGMHGDTAVIQKADGSIVHYAPDTTRQGSRPRLTPHFTDGMVSRDYREGLVPREQPDVEVPPTGAETAATPEVSAPEPTAVEATPTPGPTPAAAEETAEPTAAPETAAEQQEQPTEAEADSGPVLPEPTEYRDEQLWKGSPRSDETQLHVGDVAYGKRADGTYGGLHVQSAQIRGANTVITGTDENGVRSTITVPRQQNGVPVLHQEPNAELAWNRDLPVNAGIGAVNASELRAGDKTALSVPGSPLRSKQPVTVLSTTPGNVTTEVRARTESGHEFTTELPNSMTVHTTERGPVQNTAEQAAVVEEPTEAAPEVAPEASAAVEEPTEAAPAPAPEPQTAPEPPAAAAGGEEQPEPTPVEQQAAPQPEPAEPEAAQPAEPEAAPLSPTPEDEEDADETPSIDGQPAQWVQAQGLGVGQLARVAGFNDQGEPTVQAGYVTGAPALVDSPTGRGGTVLAINLSPNADGSNPTTVFTTTDALGAAAQVTPGSETSLPTIAQADVKDGLPAQMPHDQFGSAVFPGSTVGSGSADGGVVTGVAGSVATVKWPGAKGEETVATGTLRVSDSHRPSGWTDDGFLVRDGMVVANQHGESGVVDRVDGDTVTFTGHSGEEQTASAGALRVVGSVAEPAQAAAQAPATALGAPEVTPPGPADLVAQQFDEHLQDVAQQVLAELGPISDSPTPGQIDDMVRKVTELTPRVSPQRAAVIAGAAAKQPGTVARIAYLLGRVASRIGQLIANLIRAWKGSGLRRALHDLLTRLRTAMLGWPEVQAVRDLVEDQAA